MNKIQYETFLDFLKRNNCEQAFQRAFYQQNGCNYLDRKLWDILDPDECFFNTSINWAKTSEGREFWLAIDELWYKEISENKSDGTGVRKPSQ